MIPLVNDLKGAGRILSSNKATVLIELYRMRPIKDATEFNYEEATQEKPLFMHWCYDDALRNGEWEIVGHQTLVGEIEMPYFWTKDAMDQKYYIRKGSTDSYDTAGERIEITKEEIQNYELKGIGNEISECKRYIKKLVLAGLLLSGE